MRIIAIEHQLEASGIIHDIHPGIIKSVSSADLLLAHSSGYIDQLNRISPKNGNILADEDTPMATGSLHAAYKAAGTVTSALADLVCNKIDQAFCAVRPPGHHATKNQTMGFCFLNNVAITALKAVSDYNLKRVAIIDFDVHQCNGTIDILQNDERFLICSSFQHPSYPYSHWQDNIPNVINIPLASGTDGLIFRKEAERVWLKSIQEFKPDLIIVSAGFDAHVFDPMAELNWAESDYYWMGQFINDLAKHSGEAKILSVLEGGYNLDALANSAMHYIKSSLD